MIVNWGMRTKILLFALFISVVPILCISYLAFHYVKSSSEEIVIAHLVSIADLKKSELENWVWARREGILAASKKLKTIHVDHEEFSGSITDNFLFILKRQFVCEKVHLTDKDGTIILSTDNADIGRKVERRFIDYSLQTKEIFLKDTLPTKLTRPKVVLTAPLFEEERPEAQISGLLVLEIQLNTQVFPMISNWPGMGRTGETLVVRRDGKHNIVFLNNLRHREKDSSPLVIPDDSQDAKPAIFSSSGDEGVIRTTDYRGVKVLAVYRHIKDLDWGFVAKIDEEEAFGLVRELRNQTIFLAFITILAVSLISVKISNSITNPLKHLEHVSGRIAKGELSIPVKIEGSGEIGSLSRSIASMQEELAISQKELLKNEKFAAIGKLSGSVAHDIRNPLGIISNSIYFLNFIGTEIKDDRVNKHIGIMKREIARANSIITDLLGFSRDSKPKMQKDSINNLIRQLCSEIETSDQVTVKTNLANDLPNIDFDPIQIQRVFLNLLNNAVYALRDNGFVKISTYSDTEYISVEFKDNGKGISPENINKMFEPLFTTKSQGVGLGLSICKTFIENHHGLIDVQSEAGQGTIITIRLPLKQPGSIIEKKIEEKTLSVKGEAA